MADCDLDTLVANSACRLPLTDRQLKEMLVFIYLVNGLATGAAVPQSMSDIMTAATCWNPTTVSPHSRLAFEVQIAQEAYFSLADAFPFPYTDNEIREQSKCLSGVSEDQLENIITWLRCALFDSLPAISP